MNNTRTTTTRKRHRVGRPSLPKGKVKSIQIGTLLDSSMYQKVKKESARRGISQNEFIRELIRNA